MNPLFFLVIMIGIISSIANKKHKEEMRKKAGQRPSSPSNNTPPEKKAGSSSTAKNMKHQSRPSLSSDAKNSRGVDTKWPWPVAEKSQNKTKNNSGSAYGGTPKYSHVVMSTLEGGHTHTESSMTGEVSCPPQSDNSQTRAVSVAKQAPSCDALFGFEDSDLVKGLLYSEILGKPKALRRN